MSCRYFTENDVEQLLDMKSAIESMRSAFQRLAQGQVDNVPRVRARRQGIVLHSMSAADDGLGLVGLLELVEGIEDVEGLLTGREITVDLLGEENVVTIWLLEEIPRNLSEITMDFLKAKFGSQIGRLS